MHSWMFLAAAILLEVAGTTSMKLADGFSKFWPSLLVFIFYFLSFAALTFALKRIELGVAYAVWAGVGTALIAMIGIAFFKEPISVLKVLSIGLIIIGVGGLNFTRSEP